MRSVKAFVLLTLLSAPSAYAAISLSQADSWWQFNGPTSGVATAGQIIDSTGNAHVASAVYNLSWSSQAADRPPLSHGLGTSLVFTPVMVTQRPGEGNSGTHVDNDTIKAAGFSASNATVAGSATYLTRLRWDGPAAGTDDKLGNLWFANNGAGALKGNMLGVNMSGALTYFNAGYTSVDTTDPRHPGSGVTSGYTVSGTGPLVLQTGVWYNLAMVVDDLNDGDKTTGKVTFYLQNAAGGEIFSSSSGSNMLVTSEVNSNLLLGGEILNANGDASNSRKSFYGAMDYFALFSGALSANDVATLFAVPEPNRALLLFGGLSCLLAVRRRS